LSSLIKRTLTKHVEITVLSQKPPGGRCALYARYAEALSAHLDLPLRIVYTAQQDAHGMGFPSLLLDGRALQPADGVILSPEDICGSLARFGPEDTEELAALLEVIEEQFLQGE
jgi:cystathionine gamma-synthase